MSKKVIILDSLFVVLIVLSTWSTMFIGNFVGSHYFWDDYYGTYLPRILIALLIFEFIMVFVTIIAAITGIKNGKKYTEKKVYGHAKTQMIMRFIQMPFYITFFYMGALSFIGLFTIPITIVIILADLLSITLSGLSSVAVYSEMRKKGFITTAEQAIYSVCSFIFCLDVPISLVAFIRAFIHKRECGLDAAIPEAV